MLDSNISAAYGRFSGGVIEANVRKARKANGKLDPWHGNISYQYTGSNFTNYILDSHTRRLMAASSNEEYQPKFNKHLVKASVEGYALKDLGILASFSTT